MSARVVGFPGMTFERAREIVASADLHRERDIITACELLFDHGTAADVLDVLALQKAGMVAGFELPPSFDGRVRRDRLATVLGLYVLVAAGLGTVSLLNWLSQTITTVLQ